MYTHTHTHTTQMGYLDVSPGIGMRHLEGPKNPDGLNLGTVYIFVNVYKVIALPLPVGGNRTHVTVTEKILTKTALYHSAIAVLIEFDKYCDSRVV